MRLLDEVYLNTDIIIKGKEYILIYKPKEFKYDEVYIKIKGVDNKFFRKDYGYETNVVFLDDKNDIQIYTFSYVKNELEDPLKIVTNKKEKIKKKKQKKKIKESKKGELEEYIKKKEILLKDVLYAIEEPEILKKIYEDKKVKYLTIKEKAKTNIFTTITKVILSLPRAIEERFSKRFITSNAESEIEESGEDE